MAVSRRPEIMADAAYAILARKASERTGQCLIDEEVLRAEGVTDFGAYRYGDAAEADLKPDLFLPGGEHV